VGAYQNLRVEWECSATDSTCDGSTSVSPAARSGSDLVAGSAATAVEDASPSTATSRAVRWWWLLEAAWIVAGDPLARFNPLGVGTFFSNPLRLRPVGGVSGRATAPALAAGRFESAAGDGSARSGSVCAAKLWVSVCNVAAGMSATEACGAATSSPTSKTTGHLPKHCILLSSFPHHGTRTHSHAHVRRRYGMR
jgi:hypothetical protein